jgi:hypothetical protein
MRGTAVGGCADRHIDRGVRRREQADHHGQDEREPRPVGDEDIDDTDREDVEDGEHPEAHFDAQEEGVDDQDPDYEEVP